MFSTGTSMAMYSFYDFGVLLRVLWDIISETMLINTSNRNKFSSCLELYSPHFDSKAMKIHQQSNKTHN